MFCICIHKKKPTATNRLCRINKRMFFGYCRFEVQQWLARNLVSHSEYRTRKRELWKQWAKEIADEIFFKLKYVPEDFTNADLLNWHQGVWQNFAEVLLHLYSFTRTPLRLTTLREQLFKKHLSELALRSTCPCST